MNECFYDESGTLVDASHPHADCGGTPDYYDSNEDPWDHTFNDPGGIWEAGWPAFVESLSKGLSDFYDHGPGGDGRIDGVLDPDNPGLRRYGGPPF